MSCVCGFRSDIDVLDSQLVVSLTTTAPLPLPPSHLSLYTLLHTPSKQLRPIKALSVTVTHLHPTSLSSFEMKHTATQYLYRQGCQPQSETRSLSVGEDEEEVRPHSCPLAGDEQPPTILG